MPDILQPKVWWILIGVNDIRSDACSADAIVAGNIRIVEEIQRHRPNVPIVINSIFPFGETELLHNNPQWNVLSEVNHRLECYVHQQQQQEQESSSSSSSTLLSFFNATDIFVLSNQTGSYVNQSFMSDFLHPSATGALLWGQQIVSKVLNLTSTTQNQEDTNP